MTNFLYHLHLWYSRVSASLSQQKHLYTARFAFLHELVPILTKKADGTQILLARSRFHRFIAAKPMETQHEIGHAFFIGKPRSGKGLAIETNLVTWPHSTIVNDIKGELYERTAGYRSRIGKVFRFDPRGYGHRYDPLEGLDTYDALRSAAYTLLYRPDEGKNAVFTERAIMMLTCIFLAARLEGQRPLPFAYKVLNEGLYGVATILKIITEKHNYYPNLVTKFLDMPYDLVEKDKFSSKFLQDCYSTMTARLNNILTPQSVTCFMGSDFTAKDIITSKTSVYLCWPEHEVGALSPLVQLIWGSFVNGMTAYYDSVQGAGCRRVLLVLDEILRTGLPELPNYISTCLGRHITCLISAQNISQLDYAFGRAKTHALLGQMESAIFYRPAKADNETAEYIEKCLSYTSGFAHSKTEHEHGESQGASETRRSLKTANEIKLIDKTHVFIEMEGEKEGIRSILAERLDHRKIPALAGRLNMEPPVVPVLPPLPVKHPNDFYTPRFPIPLYRMES